MVMILTTTTVSGIRGSSGTPVRPLFGPKQDTEWGPELCHHTLQKKTQFLSPPEGGEPHYVNASGVNFWPLLNPEESKIDVKIEVLILTSVLIPIESLFGCSVGLPGPPNHTLLIPVGSLFGQNLGPEGSKPWPKRSKSVKKRQQVKITWSTCPGDSKTDQFVTELLALRGPIGPTLSAGKNTAANNGACTLDMHN